MSAHELEQVMVTVRRCDPRMRRWFVVLRPATPLTMAATQKLRPIRSE